MDLFAQMAKKIIEKQSTIIGPIAVEQAEKINGLVVSWEDGKHEVSISGDGQAAIDRLVEQYKKLFGQISVEVCKEAASPLLNQLPESKQPKTLE